MRFSNLKKGTSLTLPEVQEVICHKYELRYNLLSEQSEYRERDGAGDFTPITKRVYMTWLMEIQAEGYHYTWLEGVRSEHHDRQVYAVAFFYCYYSLFIFSGLCSPSLTGPRRNEPRLR